MTSRKSTVERREYRRYGVVPHLLASLCPDLSVVGPIINIGMGGLQFRYVGGAQDVKRLSKLNISLTDGSFYLFRIPSRPIWECALSEELCFDGVAPRYCGVEFHDLTHTQESELRYLIQLYTTADDRAPLAAHSAHVSKGKSWLRLGLPFL